MDAAKLLRLTELLSLTPEQASGLTKIIIESQASITSLDFIEGLTQRGNYILKSMSTLLDSQQNTAFLALVERTRNNTIEAGAQRQLAEVIEKVDLTPQQRQQAVERLRANFRDEIGQLSPQLAILSETSPLPLGGNQLPASSLRSPRSGNTDSAATPEATAEALRDILTPGQNAQLEAIATQKRRLLEFVPGLPR